LLVEDEPAVRNIAARILRRQGYLVFEASCPSDALAISQTTVQIDLLLTDLLMPEMSGLKLAGALVLVRPGLKVLYMTGHAGALLEQGRPEALASAELVIQKPFTADALLDRVSASLLAPTPAT
jgi:CheY-like chemotaxis protein